MKKSLSMVSRLRKIAPMMETKNEVSLPRMLESYAEIILHFWLIFIGIMGILNNYEPYKVVLWVTTTSFALVNFLNSLKRFFKM